MRFKIVTDEIYLNTIIIIETDNEESLKQFNILSEMPDFNDFLGCVLPGKFNGDNCQFVIFNGKPDISTIAHECYHVVSNVMYIADIEFDCRNDEPGAYFLGWITKKVYDFVNS